MTDDVLLEVKNLNKVYEDGYHAVRGVSFKLKPGKLVGLIGPNGCGKSTMMHCINRLINPSSGEIILDGKSVLEMNHSDVAKQISNVPPEVKGGFGLTVYETVMLGRYPFMKNRWWESIEEEEFIIEVLKAFGVDHLKNRPIQMLSSGEQQRVLIAKAYVQKPRLMLVDEPTSHLDMKYKLDVMEYLNAMAKKDMTVLVAEHDISLMARYCDYCLIMKKGEIIAAGNPKEIITAELIEDVYGVSVSVGLDKDGEIFVLPKRFHDADYTYGFDVFEKI